MATGRGLSMAEELELQMQFENGHQQVMRLRPPLLIGRSQACHVRIRHWRMARQHARLVLDDGEIVLEDLGSLAGTQVNGQRMVRYGPLEPDDEIIVGPCLMTVRRARGADLDSLGVDLPGDMSAKVHESGHVVHGHEVDSTSSAVPTAKVAGRGAGGVHAEGVSGRAEMLACVSQVQPTAGSATTADTASAFLPSPSAAASSSALQIRPDAALRRRLHAALLDGLDPRRRDVTGMSDERLRAEALVLMHDIVAAVDDLPPGLDREGLCRAVVDEAVGLGVLEALLQDPGVSEIMVNRHDEIYVERQGRLMRDAACFSSEQAVLGVIERIVSPLGRRIDESSPMVDARLPDGSRVHAIVAPVALRGACLTIRKFPLRRPAMADLVAGASLDGWMARFLESCVRQRTNILIAGGTGSGKTTLLNVLAGAIPEAERIVTIEDAAELRLAHSHLVSLEARPPNQEGNGQISIRELVRNALRMRPDRIVVGECRGAEAFDMLAAMNTGHEGSMTTLHANTPRDALARLETMILMAGMDLPLQAIREHIAASIDLIIQQSRLPGGQRCITSIVEVCGLESGTVQLQELFAYRPAGQGGVFQGCGLMPVFMESWRQRGIEVQPEWFTQQSASPKAGHAC